MGLTQESIFILLDPRLRGDDDINVMYYGKINSNITRFQQAIAYSGVANSQDPHQEMFEGKPYPRNCSTLPAYLPLADPV